MSDWYPELLQPFTDLDEARQTELTKCQLYGLGRKDALRKTTAVDFAGEFPQMKEIYIRDAVRLDAFTQLPSLQRFTIDFASQYPDYSACTALPEVARIPTLRYIGISGAREWVGMDDRFLTPEFYEVVAQHHRLESLEIICSDDADDEDLKNIARSTSLRSLRLDDLDAGPEGLKALGSMTQLEQLIIHRADITAEVIEAWSSLPRLRMLDLFDNKRELNIPLKALVKVSGMISFRLGGKLRCSEQELRQCLKHWPRLENFAVDGRDTGPELGDDFLKDLSRLPNLNTVRIRGGSFSWNGIAKLCRQQQLAALDLEASIKWCNADHREEFHFPFLKHLNASRFFGGSRGLDRLEAFPALETLELKSTGVDEGVCKFIGSLKSLRYLNLADCELVCDEALQALVDLRDLEFLDLGGCRRISDRGLEIVSGFKKLRWLSLRGCSSITDRGISYLANLKRLEDLNIDDCVLLTDYSLHLLSVNPGIVRLSICNCDRITPRGIRQLYDWTSLGQLFTSDESEEVLDLIWAIRSRFYRLWNVAGPNDLESGEAVLRHYPLRGRMSGGMGPRF